MPSSHELKNKNASLIFEIPDSVTSASIKLASGAPGFQRQVMQGWQEIN
jgi:hypothetical protein